VGAIEKEALGSDLRFRDSQPESFSLLPLGEELGLRAYRSNPFLNFYRARMAFNDKGHQLEFAAPSAA
jgi:hypothetical protein